MNIMDLDEAEGLTAEMVQEYLARHGWTKATLDAVDPSRWSMGGSTVWLPLESVELAVTIQGLTRVERRSPQAILREMNPRMRKGLPTDTERAAHAGRWIAGRTGEYTHTTILRFIVGMGGVVKFQFEDHRPTFDPSTELDKWSFWPCDAHGNKGRWPKVSP